MDPQPRPWENVLDRFTRVAHENSTRPLFVFVDGEGRDEESLTYGAVLSAAERVAWRLTDRFGLSGGDRALMVYPPSLDFVTAFVACLLVGIVPVPVAPPNPFKVSHRDLATFDAVARSSGSAAILTNKGYQRSRRLGAIRTRSANRDSAWFHLPWHSTDRGTGGTGTVAHQPAGPDEAAFLQYTSGSTGDPRGVMISHRNIDHQLAGNAHDLSLAEASRSVIWLPHFHDFCLVSGILSALNGNGVLYLMSPLTFLRRPHLWFDVLSRIGATHTAAPDFAYRLAVRRTTPDQRRQWDLSSVQVMMTAGEPVRRSTVDAFLSAFAEARLDSAAFAPAYGLAEHTVAVSTSGRNRLTIDRQLFENRSEVVPVSDAGTAETLTIFGCGPPSPGVDVRIVDPETSREVEPGRVGEVWVESPSKALGYFGLPEASQQTFHAVLTGSTSRYLRTGDLGFFLDGELHIAGRSKDLIIVRGRNIYPQDLEETAFSCHPLVRPGRAVAFAAPDPDADGNRVVVLVEVREERLAPSVLDEVVHAVRSRIVADHQIACDEVAVAQPGVVMKTSSGKLRRRANRDAYLSGEFDSRLLRVDVRESTPRPTAQA